MEKWKIDVPVLLIFFARPDVFEKVFESVREAKPSTLLLWQDGPRENRPDDIENIEKCRKIAENIDWECTVYRNYHEKNMGCDPSTFLSHKWAFSIVDKCIILEDDMVAKQSFYPFCKELLDKYENDERINHICGVNPLGDCDWCKEDYFFAYTGTGAWASWKRVAETWDEDYTFLDDKRAMYNQEKRIPYIHKAAYKTALHRRSTQKQWWETILGFGATLNNRLVIISKKNLVTNIGITENAVHGSMLKLMNKRVKKLFFAKSYDVEFPIKHPKYMLPDYKYFNELTKINCTGRPFRRFYRKIEYILKCIVYGEIFNKVKKKFKKA
ncbi:MAG: hypothetical protein IKK77_03815 [Clostridia bacterium]|nr:hypothetical protein [Clostridia bacterium]